MKGPLNRGPLKSPLSIDLAKGTYSSVHVLVSACLVPSDSCLIGDLFGTHLKGAICSARVSKEVRGPIQPKKPQGPRQPGIPQGFV